MIGNAAHLADLTAFGGGATRLLGRDLSVSFSGPPCRVLAEGADALPKPSAMCWGAAAQRAGVEGFGQKAPFSRRACPALAGGSDGLNADLPRSHITDCTSRPP